MTKHDDPGYGPVYRWIDDSKDPDNSEKRKAAEKWMRENPDGLVIHHIIVHPPDRSSWPGYHWKAREASKAVH
jgi:hypothetical protein